MFSAHVGVFLSDEYPAYEKDTWFPIKAIHDITFKWRIKKNGLLEIIAEPFAVRATALYAAKNMYTSVIYYLLRKQINILDAGSEFYAQSLITGDSTDYHQTVEDTFCWTQKYLGGGVGISVYEIEKSFDEYNKYDLPMRIGNITTSRSNMPFNFSNIGYSPFTYDEFSQPLIHRILTAVNSYDEGFAMTVYCGILELLAEVGEPKPKEITDEIDELIIHVQESNLSKEYQNELIGFLIQGKNASSRQRCKALIKKYAKEKYGEYKAVDIFNNAYGLRSSYSHGNESSVLYNSKAAYMLLVVLDVLGGYMRDKQQSM